LGSNVHFKLADDSQEYAIVNKSTFAFVSRIPFARFGGTRRQTGQVKGLLWRLFDIFKTAFSKHSQSGSSNGGLTDAVQSQMQTGTPRKRRNVLFGVATEFLRNLSVTISLFPLFSPLNSRVAIVATTFRSNLNSRCGEDA
jgi:hypothetical protein